jgi:predicted metal-dependent hydrolase
MNLNLPFPVEVVRTDRKKSASIEVAGDTIRVIVPKTLSEARVEQLVSKRIGWIRQKVRLQSEIVLPKPKEYVSGESFTYLGKNYRLKLLQEGPEGVKLKNGYLTLSCPRSLSGKARTAFVREQLEQWYIDHALDRFKEKTHRFSKVLGISPKTINVRDYKSRWGSCSASGDVSYNWRIIMAPHHIVDYVVVHELCHMLEHNHSPKYWKHVENVIPGYREDRDWLKVNGIGLQI